MNSPLFDSLTPADQEKIMKTIDVLLQNNPALPEQLAKLAVVKQTKPFIFKMVIGKLKNI